MAEGDVSMGPYLRQLVSGPIEVMLRQTEPGHRTVVTAHGAGLATGQDLIAFQAVGFREIGHQSDIWEFDVNEQQPAPSTVVRRLRIAICGHDIAMVRTERAVA